MTVVNSCVSLEETWEMSQVHNRANAITIPAMDLVSCGLQPSVCELVVTLFPSLLLLSLRLTPDPPNIFACKYLFPPNGGTVWENAIVQSAIYFQSGFEAAGCKDKVLQCRGKLAALKYLHQHEIKCCCQHTDSVHSYFLTTSFCK